MSVGCKPDDITRQALGWNPQGKRKVGRPRTSWRRSCDAELKKTGPTWGQINKMAQNGAMEVCCGGPLFHWKCKEISQVSQVADCN